ncbi:MAG: HDOD domain-containing protein [Chloroflexi bacterium]|nr:MAG: HDOD domain-containing protein [Chloroflexota bacterium]
MTAIKTTPAQMQKVLACVDDLKALPTTIVRALQLLDEPGVSVNEIVSVLSVDQAITARLLKLANSAYYGTRYRASTLHEAVMRLGFKRTKNLLFALSYSTLLSRRVAGYNLGRGELWRHSVAVALTAQRLSERVAYAAPDEAYVAGLLHDIGKLMLDQYFTMDWDALLASVRSHNQTLIEAEESWWGMNHAQVGAELARKWDLPAVLVDAIEFHHTPQQADQNQKLAAIVNLANIICLELGIGLADPELLTDSKEEALQILSLSVEDVEELRENYREMLEYSLGSNNELMPANG